MAAATRARRVDPQARILVLESSGEFSRGSCSLPYALSDEVPLDSLQGTTREALEADGIELRLHHQVCSIQPTPRRLSLASGEEITYDRLIVSTGSRSRPLSELGDPEPHPRLWRLRTRADAEHIQLLLQRGRIRKIAVVGGGYLGLEMTEVLTHLGCSVTLYHRPHTLMRLHPSLQQPLQRLLEKRDVVVRTGCRVQRVYSSQEELTVELVEDTGRRQNESFEAVLLAPGVEPESHLLAHAGARLGPRGGVRVDLRGQTSLDQIWAAGDGVELPDQRGGCRYTPLATCAARLGRVCGENAVGGSLRLASSVACVAVRLFALQVSSAGYPEDWEDTEVIELSFGSSASPYARRGPGWGALYLDRRGRLMGGQFLAPEASSLADLASLAIQQEMTLEQLADLDHSYTPPLASLWHPFYLAARQAVKSRTGVHR